MVEEDLEIDYKTLANSLKDQGNDAFQRGNIEESITFYSQAIDVDPDNHVLYSNRSAAYMKADSISKALRDAEKCVELAPNWTKGYNRLGAAQQGLGRFDAAIDTFKKGIEIEPDNQPLWTALRACQEALNTDKKYRFSEAAKEREEEQERLRRKEIAAEAQAKKSSEELLSSFFSDVDASSSSSLSAAAPNNTSSTPAAAGDDLLAGFFSELLPAESAPSVTTKVNSSSAASVNKYSIQDLGSSEEQLARLTQSNYQWRNLNPYHVLQLDIDATEEDVKQRYKKLSTRVHPDKLLGHENARTAFEEVKTAYQKLMDEKQRNVAIMNIEYVREEYLKERRRLISKGVKESSLPSLESELEKRTMKHFAEVEMGRRRAETNLRGYNARERIQEDQEKEKMRLDTEKEQAWANVERREKRVGQWRDFQEDPDAKKLRLASYKEEHRADSKHGAVKLEEWKKSWK